jgi:hypothetical protein
VVGVGEGEEGCLHTPLDGYLAACLFLCMNDYIGEMDGHFSSIYYYYISSISYHISFQSFCNLLTLSMSLTSIILNCLILRDPSKLD